MKTYSTKTNAIRAARKELGSDAVTGLDFTVIEQSPGRWGHVPRNAAAGATPALQTAAQSNDALQATDEVPEPASTHAAPIDNAPTAPAAPPERKTREGSKQAELIEMLKRPEGVTVAEAAEALNWANHTVRGAMAGELKKKLGLTIGSVKVDGRGRVYRLA